MLDPPDLDALYYKLEQEWILQRGIKLCQLSLDEYGLGERSEGAKGAGAR